MSLAILSVWSHSGQTHIAPASGSSQAHGVARNIFVPQLGQRSRCSIEALMVAGEAARGDAPLIRGVSHCTSPLVGDDRSGSDTAGCYVRSNQRPARAWQPVRIAGSDHMPHRNERMPESVLIVPQWGVSARTRATRRIARRT